MQDGSNGIKGAPVTNALDDDEVDAGGALGFGVSGERAELVSVK